MRLTLSAFTNKNLLRHYAKRAFKHSDGKFREIPLTSPVQVVTSNLATPTSTTATPLAKKSSSVPSGLDSPQHQQQGSASKKRKLFTQSLGEDNIH